MWLCPTPEKMESAIAARHTDSSASFLSGLVMLLDSVLVVTTSCRASTCGVLRASCAWWSSRESRGAAFLIASCTSTTLRHCAPSWKGRTTRSTIPWAIRTLTLSRSGRQMTRAAHTSRRGRKPRTRWATSETPHREAIESYVGAHPQPW